MHGGRRYKEQCNGNGFYKTLALWNFLPCDNLVKAAVALGKKHATLGMTNLGKYEYGRTHAYVCFHCV